MSAAAPRRVEVKRMVLVYYLTDKNYENRNIRCKKTTKALREEQEGQAF